MQVTIDINGEQVSRDVEPRQLLVHFIRDTPGLTGTHWGCDTSNCGACVVLMDGRPVKSCTTLAVMCEGHEIRTVESLEVDGRLDPIQQGFHETHALQCGFCTPGMLMTESRAARREPEPDRRGDPHRHLRLDLSLHGLQEHRRRGQVGGRARGRHQAGGMRMATVENLPSATEERPIGFGRLKRKEDARFIRGQGNYLDDIRLPGMVHGAILRSPFAHARILSIDTSRALALPGVAAVVTAKDLETLGLAWMPTISYDTQAVLAGDKVRFQGQEVAFVIATDEYIARDALQLIDVEYEPLPAVVNARKALDPDAPLIRDDKTGQVDNLASPTWEAGDEDATDRAFAEADTVVDAGHHLSALPSGAARDLRDDRRLQSADRAAQHLQRQPGAARPPDRVRPGRRACRAHDPDRDRRHRRRLRQQGADLSRATCARSPGRSSPACRSSGSRTAPRT